MRSIYQGGASSVNKWLRRYLEVAALPLRLLAVLMRTFVSNRNRLSYFTARERVAAALKILSVVTICTWLAIWVFASDAQRGRLTETVKAYLAGNVEGAQSERD